ncbi:MAG TPA: VOC family protein, partial [Phenylobacterium sp.]
MDEPGVSTANVRQVVPFFRTRDMDAALGFYVDGLGFTVTRRWEPDGRLRWCWIELGQGALMLQLVDATSEVPPGERPLGQGVLICLMCDDAIAIWREAR